MEDAAANLVFLLHDRDGFVLIERGASLAAALGVIGDGFLQLLRNTEVVNDESPGFVLEDPVDPRNGLHQPMSLHRLIDIHRVQTGNIETSQPHVTNNDDLEWVFRLLKAILDILAHFACHEMGRVALWI